MVSLTTVAAALGLVTFGNAEVALRYLNSSSQLDAPPNKPTLIKSVCSQILEKPEVLDNYLEFCHLQNVKLQGTENFCHALYNTALHGLTEHIFQAFKDEIETYELADIGDKIQDFFEGFPKNGNHEEKTKYVEGLYPSLYASISKRGQSEFGFKGKHPFFLARLSNQLMQQCYMVKKP